jgi:hypothetical protein
MSPSSLQSDDPQPQSVRSPQDNAWDGDSDDGIAFPPKRIDLLTQPRKPLASLRILQVQDNSKKSNREKAYDMEERIHFLSFMLMTNL